MPHTALWVNHDASQEVKIIPGDYHPEKGELLLKCICVGVNPADWKHPELWNAVNTVEGCDAVGEIVEIGPQVTGFELGQKVLTFARAVGPTRYGAAQEYFLAQASTTWLFDESVLSEEQAATIPTTLCTACDALYNKMQPPLPLPWEEACNWPILIWGAGSQVGIQAVQFAKASGCSPIIATASPKQHEYLKSLGADVVFDYRDRGVQDRIRDAVPQGKTLMHALDCVGVDIQILESLVEPGGTISLALPPTRESPNHHVEMAVAGIIHDLENWEFSQFRFVDGIEPRDSTGAARLRQLMDWALKEIGNRYRPPKVRKLSGKGLYDALEAFPLMKAGKISGEKVVWRMAETPGLQNADE